MTVEQLYRQLREADPAAGLDRDPHGPTANHLMERARTGTTRISAPSRRTRTVVALAAALMVVSTGAVATGVFQPDPADVATIMDDAQEAADVHLPGWRPVLNAEDVWCHYPGGQSIRTPASEFPLDEPLTLDHITAECATNDLARILDTPPATSTVCAATIADGAYDERFAARDEPVLDGDISQARPIFPVVLGWDATCEQIDLDFNPPVALSTFTDADLDAINHAREIEISLRALALQRCVSREEAVELGRQAREHLAGEWPLIALPARPFGPDCHQIRIDEWGLLRLETR